MSRARSPVTSPSTRVFRRSGCARTLGGPPNRRRHRLFIVNRGSQPSPISSKHVGVQGKQARSGPHGIRRSVILTSYVRVVPGARNHAKGLRASGWPGQPWSLIARISLAVGVVFLDRSAMCGCQCRRLRVIACRAPASVVLGVRGVHGNRNAPTLPAGQETTVADCLATRRHHRLLRVRFAGSSVGVLDLPGGVRDRHRNPGVVGVRGRRCCECHADRDRYRCWFLHGLPGPFLLRRAVVAQVDAKEPIVARRRLRRDSSEPTVDAQTALTWTFAAWHAGTGWPGKFADIRYEPGAYCQTTSWLAAIVGLHHIVRPAESCVVAFRTEHG